ncbi:MAG TPA: response regulator transcription factor [Steroidobacteraceae bacterium]|jgi:DNA-binding NarL/FixJ family response regulator|nr:response regulator transcription factor [Steroidobacteraceae bacterium]
MTVHPLRVLIAEDNDDLRDLLVTLVSAEPDLRCVGTAQDVDAVIASTVEQKADVLVLDLELQGRSSIDVLKTVRKAGSKVIIIVFSGHSHPDMVRHTLAAGADAYIPKNGDFELLLDAIRDKRATARNEAPDHPA